MGKAPEAVGKGVGGVLGRNCCLSWWGDPGSGCPEKLWVPMEMSQVGHWGLERPGIVKHQRIPESLRLEKPPGISEPSLCPCPPCHNPEL